MTVTKKQFLPALHKSDNLKSPDFPSVEDKNYTSTILKYANLALPFPQLDTNAKTVVAAINELYHTKSTVIPNPPDTPTDNLYTVKIDGDTYRVSGGSTVIPNPPVPTSGVIITEDGQIIITEGGDGLLPEQGGPGPTPVLPKLYTIGIDGEIYEVAGDGGVEYYPGRGIFFSAEITEEFYTEAPQESGSGAGLSYTTCPLKYKADTTYGNPVTICHPIRGSLFGGVYDSTTNSVLVTCRDYVPEGTLIQIKYTANIAEANSINADAGRRSPAYTYIQFRTDYMSPKNSWKSTGTYVDGNLVQVSQAITDPPYKCFSWGQLEITGIQDITLYVKQDSINTNTAYILISKPGKTFRVNTTDTFNGDGVTNVFTLSHEVYRPPMAPYVTFEPSGSYPNTVSGNTITFTGNIPPVGTKISVQYYYMDTSANKVFKSYKGVTTSDYDSCYINLGAGTSDYYQRVVDILYVKDGDATISNSVAYFYYEAGTAYIGANGEIFNDYDNNYAIGFQSHAEGGSSLAMGNRSHAEGMSKAIGSFSHSEGDRACAYGYSSHAEGTQTVASGSESHAEGMQTVASGSESHAEGGSTQALGDRSHAEGGSTYAEGTYSHSEGVWTHATGGESHAEGDNTRALSSSAHAEGQLTIAEGAQSHAEGSGTKALGQSSHAEGNYTQASGYTSHAEGDYSVASGKASHAEGDYTTASGQYAHAEGLQTSANGSYSHAEGNSTTANGYGTHAEGIGTFANSNYSHAEGNNTQSNGLYSHAEGYNSQASGIASHAEGDSRAYADYAHSEGYGTMATSPGAHAEGYNSHSHAPYTHSQNLENWVVSTANTALGKYNKYTDSDGNGLDLAVMVGNGTDDEHRSNAYTLDWNGNATFAGDITLGTTLSTTAQTIGGAINELYQTGGGSQVSVTQKVSTGTNIADIIVDGVTTQLFAPTSGGSNVIVTPVQLSGNHIADIEVDGVTSELYSPEYTPTEVEVTQVQASGTKIATIEVDGSETDIYAPDAVGSVTVDDTLSTGIKVATITVDGVDTEILVPDAGDSVSVTQITSTGTHIADIEVDGVTTELYAPNGGGAVIDDTVIALDKTWSSSKINSELTSLADRIEAIERYLWGIPLITEDGYQRITEDGSERILEQEE